MACFISKIVRLALLILLVALLAAASAAGGAQEGFVVTIIGSGNPQLSAQRANPCVLVEYGGAQFLIDCGSGAMAGLLKAGVEPGRIRNMLFTHHHADHNADYWGFAIGGWGYPDGRRELFLAGPVGTRALHQVTLDFYQKDLDYRTQIVGFPEEGIRKNVTIKELTEETERFDLEGVRITVIPVPHTIETYAYRFAAGGQSVVVSGDLTYTPRFAPFAKDADIIVFDGQMSIDFSDLPPEVAPRIKENLLKSHISNAEIARVAADASPGKFVLTHLSGTMDLVANTKKYREAGYRGEVIEARDGLKITP